MRTVLLLLTLLTQKVVEPSEGIHGKISGELYRETPHFQIYIEKAYVPVDLDWLEGEVEKIHAYLVERTGVQTSERFAITFRPPDPAPCPMRGLARFDEPGPGQAIIFVDDNTTLAQFSGVLAHEIGHLFHARVLKNGTMDMNLVEGFATWEAGKYWQGWQGTPTANVLKFRREQRYIPLERSYREAGPSIPDSANCLKERDLRYNSWAAFIDYLIAEYGLDKFRQLLGAKGEPPALLPSNLQGKVILITPGIDLPKEIETLFSQTPITTVLQPPPEPNFNGVYAQTLGELEKAWLKKLDDTEAR